MYDGHLPRRRRRGIVLLIAIALLAFVALAALALATSARQLREADRAAERQLQADLLVDSGFERAAAQLARDPNYTGETWRLTSEELHNTADETAEVEIEVHPGGQAGERQVTVRATWPVDASEAVRASGERVLPAGK